MKRISLAAILALLSTAAVTSLSYGDANTVVAAPGTATGAVTGTTTTGSTPPSPKVVAAPNSPAAASSGAVFTSPSGVYKGTGSSPQNQATGDRNAQTGTADKP